YDSGNFGPSYEIRRDHLAVMLARYRELAAPVSTSCDSKAFTDMGATGFCGAVTWLVKSGITTGYDSDKTFRPADRVSRQHVAAFLYRYDGKFGPSPTVPASFTLRGSGYGHGVGMPQYGAYAQALAN